MLGQKMRPLTTLLCFLACWVFVSSASAQDQHKMRTMMMAIGADAWIESFAEGMARSDNPASAEPDLGWKQAASEVFKHEEIFDTLVDRMKGMLSDEELDEILEFLASDVGRAVTRMEIEAQNPDIADGVDMAGAQIVEDLTADEPARLDKYRDMLAAIDAIESGVTTALNMNFAVLSGMSASGRMSYSLSEGEILTLLAAQEDTIREQIGVASLQTAAFTYRDLSDDDLATYVDFLTSEAGRRLYSVMNGVADEIMAERGRAFGTRIIELQGVQEL